MRKLLNPREWIGTGIQLCIFAALLPFLSIVLGMMMKAAPDVRNTFVDAVFSALPFADPVQNTITGLDLSTPAFSIVGYANALLATVEGNLISAMYIGMWQYAFRMIFKELLGGVLRLYGLPVLQVVCGLFFGALTFTMLDDPMMALLATSFLIVLNIVLTLICVKSFWKKLIDVVVNMGLQSYLAMITIGYVVSLGLALRGYYNNMIQAITSILICTLLLMIYLVAQYLVTDK